MASPIWLTPEGSLGKFFTDTDLIVNLLTTPVYPSTQITYSIISGDFPPGTSTNPVGLDTNTGVIRGTPHNVLNETIYSFTIRATDEYNNIADRTFSMTMISDNQPKFITPPGVILHVVDSIYVNYDLQYQNNNTANPVIISQTSGNLPPGLQLTTTGKILGYPLPPISSINAFITETYTFVVQIASPLGNDTQTYSIQVSNQRLNNPPNTRRPVILNTEPLIYPVPASDSLYDYYLGEDAVLPDFYTGDFFSFKIIGYDFDNSPIRYNFSNLPLGLTGDSNTGWITGNPVLPNKGIITFDFFVTVEKVGNTVFNSGQKKFTITLINSIKKDIVWITPTDLGMIDNGSISTINFEASSLQSLSYRFIDGTLPPNLSLLDTGELVGRVAFQPLTELLPVGATTTYTFTIMAYSPQYYLLTSTQTFTLTVFQKFDQPLDNIYIKALPNAIGRKILYSLLNDSTIIPDNMIYRPKDPYFGKSNEVKYIHAYGMQSGDLAKYTDAVSENHYERKLTLGNINYAIARDDSFNILYEVVYSEIVDELSTNGGLPDQLLWPKNINLRQGGYSINNTNLYTTSGTAYTSFTPGYARELYPSSLINMRNRVTTIIGQNNDISLLPKWMTSQQSNGDTLGYIPVWVICYAFPGQGQNIVDSINNKWSHKLNEIDFTVNRYVVDKSMSYNWNANFINPFWSTLPSATPVPDSLDKYDLTILFPRKTILPINVEN